MAEKKWIGSPSVEELLVFWAEKAQEMSLIKIDFKNPLYLEAFTHKSFQNEQSHINFNYERLEFLGDALLQAWSAAELFKKFKEKNEGQLSIMRSAMVNEKSLAKLSKILGWDFLVLLGKGELKDDGHKKESVLGDIFEAFLGAYYLVYEDIDKVFAVLSEMMLIAKKRGFDFLAEEFSIDFDEKTKLQNLVMKNYPTPPEYKTVELKSGEYKYRVDLIINHKKVLSQETNFIKKTQKKLAKNALDKKLYERTSCY